MARKSAPTSSAQALRSTSAPFFHPRRPYETHASATPCLRRFFAGSTTTQQSSKAPAQQSAGVELASARPGARSACSLAAFQQLASCSPARCAPNAQLRPQPHVRKSFTGCSTMTQRNRAPAQRLRSAQRASRSLPTACQACSADVYAARQLAPIAQQRASCLPTACQPSLRHPPSRICHRFTPRRHPRCAALASSGSATLAAALTACRLALALHTLSVSLHTRSAEGLLPAPSGSSQWSPG